VIKDDSRATRVTPPVRSAFSAPPLQATAELLSFLPCSIAHLARSRYLVIDFTSGRPPSPTQNLRKQLAAMLSFEG